MVDDFVDVAGAVEDDVDELEASVFSPERTDDIGRLYQLKRELMSLRKAVSPLEVPLQKLADRQIDVVPEAMRSYFRDVQDHAIRVRDQVGGLDELLTSILQASLARTSLADNEDMRKISAWAAIIAVPTADHRHLRHELPLHARAATGAGAIPPCCCSSSSSAAALPRLQAQRLAVATQPTLASRTVPSRRRRDGTCTNVAATERGPDRSQQRAGSRRSAAVTKTTVQPASRSRLSRRRSLRELIRRRACHSPSYSTATFSSGHAKSTRATNRPPCITAYCATGTGRPPDA